MRPFMAPATPAEACLPVGAYLTDETRLVQVLESDHAGVLVEDARTEQWFELPAPTVATRWRLIEPEP